MLKRKNLTSAVSAALIAMILPVPTLMAADLDGVVIDQATDNVNAASFKDGGEHFVRSSTITTRGVYSHGIYANSGSQVAISDTNVTALGDRSRALWAAGSGTALIVSGGELSTHGKATTASQPTPLGPAVVIASAGALVELHGSTISSSGQNGDGLNAEGGSVVVMNGGSIQTTGLQAKGLASYGSSASSAIHLLGVDLITRGNSARGAVSSGSAGNVVTLNDSRVTTYGAGSHALEASAGSRLSAASTNVTTSGNAAHGLTASGAGSSLTYSDGMLKASGQNSSGVIAQNNALVALQRAQFDSTATGIRAASGSKIDVEDVYATTHQSYAHGVEATGIGSTVSGSDMRVSTSGQFSYGLRANEAGTVEIHGAGVSTSGDFGHGVIADTAGSRMTVSAADITTEGGRYAMGVRAADGGFVDISGAKVTTRGNGSYGLNAIGAGSLAKGQSLRIETFGDEESETTASGVVAEWGGVVDVQDSDVLTHGASAIGLLAQVSGDAGNPDTLLTAKNLKVSTSGIHSFGAMACALVAGRDDSCADPAGSDLPASGARAALDIAASTIATTGAGSHGLYAYGPAGAMIRASGSMISTSGMAAHGAVAEAGADLLLQDSQVQVEGDESIGILGLNNARLTVHNTTVKSAGERAHGISNNSGSQLRLDRAQIETLADGAFGAIVRNDNSYAELAHLQVRTHGSDAIGLSVDYGTSSAALADSAIFTMGAGSNAARVQDGARLDISNSVLKSEAATALLLNSGTLAATEGTTIEGNGILAEFGSDAASTLSFDRNVVVLGDIRFAGRAVDADGNGTLDRSSSLSLDSNSSWRGATDAIGDLSLANRSRWDVTGDSQVGALSLVGSSVVFDHSNGQYKNLTVDGNFHADNGLLAMNTSLGDDASPTDLLHVKGDTSGNAHIAVTNIGGTGAQTEDGIKLVQVDGVSAGEYALAGRAVGGAYEYSLYHGGRINPNDGDWYLRSELSPVNPPVAPCDGSGCAIDPPVKPLPVFRPEAGAYLANQASAVGLFNMDLHERVGEPNLAQRQGAGGNLDGAWARVTTDQPRYRVNDQLSGQGRQNVLQIGSDLTFWGKQDRGVVGVMAASGQATNRLTSSLTGYSAEGRVGGRALGLYSTWIQNAEDDDGLYVDGWLQSARFKNRVQGDALLREQYRSRSISTSIEAGYALRLHQNETRTLYLEPQVQAIWSDYRVDGGQHQELNGTLVKAAEAGGLQTRVGARLYGHSTSMTGNRVQPFVAVNWIRNGSDANAVWMGEQRVQGIAPKDVYEAKLGAQLQLSPKLSGWGELSTQQGEYGFRSVGGQLGVKYMW